MTRLLALDCATHVGYAVFDDGRLIASGCADMSAPTQGLVFSHFRGWLEATIEQEGVTEIVFEKPHLQGYGASLMCVGFVSRVIEAADVRGIPRCDVHTGTLKKWATGHGKATKEQMIDAAVGRSGGKVDSDDEADAILLGYYWLDNTPKPKGKKHATKTKRAGGAGGRRGRGRVRADAR